MSTTPRELGDASRLGRRSHHPRQAGRHPFCPPDPRIRRLLPALRAAAALSTRETAPASWKGPKPVTTNPGTVALPVSDVLPLDQQRDIVRDLTRSALGEYDEELKLFEGDMDAYLDHRWSVPANAPEKDVPAGFGADIFVSLVPYVVVAATAVMNFLGDYLAGILKDEAKPLIGEYIRRLFKLGSDKPAAPTATPAQPAPVTMTPELLARVKDVAKSVCKRYGLNADDTDLISSAMVGKLAVPA